MLVYVARRLLQSLFVLLGVSVIVFGLLHLTGDPTRLLLPLEAREAKRHGILAGRVRELVHEALGRKAIRRVAHGAEIPDVDADLVL